MRRIGVLLCLLVALHAQAQTSVRGVTPGVADAAAVARVFGPPLRTVSDTLAEHASGDAAAKLFVQYGTGTAQRIELAYPAGVARSAALAAAGNPGERPRERTGALGRTEELYDAAAVVLTHRGGVDAPVTSVAFFSRTVYDSTFGRAAATPPPRPPPRTGSEYVCCYKDTSVFDLDGFLERSAQNTPQRCIATCRAKGFAYAAVQYGESCLCGNAYGKYGPATNCDYACTGDPAAICGGYSANSVYRTGQ